MSFFPIFGRELKVRARGRFVYWTRVAVGLAGTLICLPALALSWPMASPFGKQVFNHLVLAAFVVSCGAAILTADAISSERREGSLLHLLLTRVTAFDILVGKLGSIGIAALSGLLAFMPTLMVPLLAGGVTGGEEFRKSLALLNVLFLALAAGLCGSARQSSRVRAIRNGYVLLAAVVFGPLLTGALLTPVGGSFAPVWALFSPLGTLAAAGDLAYRGSRVAYWASLAAVHAAGWALLYVAAKRLGRVTDSKPRWRWVVWLEEKLSYTPQDPALIEGTAKWRATPNWRPHLQPGLEECESPIHWLLRREHMVGGFVWSIAVFGLAYEGWVLAATGPGAAFRVTSPLLAWPVGIVAGLLGAGMAAWVASRFFVEATRTRELELLVTTPVGAELIVAAQWKTLRRLFPWSVLVMQAPVVILLGPLAFLQIPMLVNTFLGTAALCWTGLAQGLRARGPASAIIRTVWLSKGLPFLVRLLFAIFLGFAVSGAPGPPSRGIWPGILLGELVLIAYYLYLIQRARRLLANSPIGPASFVPDYKGNLAEGFSGSLAQT